MMPRSDILESTTKPTLQVEEEGQVDIMQTLFAVRGTNSKQEPIKATV